MAYDYIKRAYGVDPREGQRVKHTVTGEFGTVTAEDPGQGHYVQVQFEGRRFSLPCHPTELEYL